MARMVVIRVGCFHYLTANCVLKPALTRTVVQSGWLISYLTENGCNLLEILVVELGTTVPYLVG